MVACVLEVSLPWWPGLARQRQEKQIALIGQLEVRHFHAVYNWSKGVFRGGVRGSGSDQRRHQAANTTKSSEASSCHDARRRPRCLRRQVHLVWAGGGAGRRGLLAQVRPDPAAIQPTGAGEGRRGRRGGGRGRVSRGMVLRRGRGRRCLQRKPIRRRARGEIERRWRGSRRGGGVGAAGGR